MENEMEHNTEDELTDSLYREQKEQQRLCHKPDISHLEDAVTRDEKGALVFLAKKGEKIIIERQMTFGDKRWLDTKTYVIQSVDPKSGDMDLYDPELEHHAGSNFKTGLTFGYVFKLPEDNHKMKTRRAWKKPRKRRRKL